MKYVLLTIQYTPKGLKITQKIDESIEDLIALSTHSKSNVPIALPEDTLFSLIDLERKSLTIIITDEEYTMKIQKEQFLKYLFSTYVVPQVKSKELYIKCKNESNLIFFISENEERLLSPYSINDGSVITKDSISEIVSVDVLFMDATKELLEQAIKIERNNNEKNM